MTALLILLALLQVGDAWTTVRNISRGAHELNPVSRWLFGKLGLIPGVAAQKLVFVAVMIGAAMALPAPVAVGVLIVACGFFAWIVARNLKT